MKNLCNKFFISLTIISSITFSSCSDSDDNLETELSMQQKIQIIESGEWLLKGFETTVMHTFTNGERFTFYGTNGVFSNGAIPGTDAYTIIGNQLLLDFSFGNTGTYDLEVSCDNNIVAFFVDGDLHSTYYKRFSNYEECL